MRDLRRVNLGEMRENGLWDVEKVRGNIGEGSREIKGRGRRGS